MKNNMSYVVAVDGASGTGKGTVTRYVTIVNVIVDEAHRGNGYG